MNGGRRLLLAAVVLLFLGAVFVLPAAAEDISISDADGLTWITASAENLSQSYVLTGDITLNAADWTGIGNSTDSFTGNFDGRGNTITLSGSHGLFNTTGGAATITNTVVSVTTEIGGTGVDNVGALAYNVTGNTAIDNCSVVFGAGGNVTGKSKVGGLVGTAAGDSGNSVVITSCSVVGGNVTGSQNVGGLVGSFTNVTLENCFAATDVFGTTSIAGGLIGNDFTGDCTITHCYAVGNVTSAGKNAGGIAGDSSSMTLSHTFALNQKVSGTTLANRITGQYPTNPGSSLSNNYAWSGITGAAFTNKTLVGESGSDVSSINIWGKSAKFTAGGFDFDTVWTLGTGENYKLPVLKNQAEPVYDASYLIPKPAIPITTEEELGWITGDNLSKSYVLINDITLSDTNWNGIGTSTAPFTGNFDGGGNTISLTAPTTHGLFNATSGDATITNTVVNVTTEIGGSGTGNVSALAHDVAGTTAIDNCSVVFGAGGKITGASDVGGLIGYVQGESGNSVVITNCSVVGGSVVGTSIASPGGNTANRFGGLVGNFRDAYMENCFAATNVSGATTIVGGLIGDDHGTCTITHCYAVGTVTGPADYVGGIAGEASSTIISHTFALNQKVTGGKRITALATYPGSLSDNYAWSGMTGATFTNKTATGDGGADVASGSIWNNKATFETEGFDFTTVWTLGIGTNYKLPVLKNQTVSAYDARYLAPPFAGSGTKDDPYLITTEEDLKNISVSGGKDVYFKLTTNITITDANWAGLGTTAAPFSGHLDGDGHTINFASPTPKTGLFAATKDAEVTNVKVAITTPIGGTDSNVGGLIGTADNTTVKGCEVTLTLPGGITGASNVGGLIGTAKAGTKVTDCDVRGTGAVTATGSNVGGLVGTVDATSSITTSSSSVAVTSTGAGVSGIGGLVGTSAGAVTNSYTTGDVTASGASVSGVGGLVGILTGTVDTSYAAGNVDDTTKVGGLIGNVTKGTLTNSVALNARVSGDADTNRTVGNNDGGTLTNNFAKAGMLDKNGGVFASGTGSDTAGADVSAASAGSISWWTSAASAGPGFSSGIWGMQDGKPAFTRQISPDPTPTPTPTPTTPSGGSSGDGNDGGVSSVAVGGDGTADFRTGTGITKASLPKGTTGVLTVDRAVSVTAPAPAGTKGVFGTYGVTFPAFEGYADLHFSVPSAILADKNLGVHDVALYRLEGTTWQKVTTYYLGESRGAAEYSALVRLSGTYAIMYEVNGAQVVLKATSEPTTGATASGTVAPGAGTTKPTTAAGNTTTHPTTPAAVKTTAPSGVSPTMTQAPAPLIGMLAGLMAAAVLLTRGRRE